MSCHLANMCYLSTFRKFLKIILELFCRLEGLHIGGVAEEVVGCIGVVADLATAPQQGQMVVHPLSEEEDAWVGVVGGDFQ